MQYIRLLRPKQWLKNLFIFLPLFFGGSLLNSWLFLQAAIAFIAFSLIASSIYCFNDIWDVHEDRLHPTKSKRPIAAGKISISGAYIILVFLLLASCSIIFLFFGELKWKIAGIFLFYYILNILYCVKLKQIAIVDVFIIALGFVLRVIIGGMVTGIYLSLWILLMTFLLALFLAFAKRRDEVLINQEKGLLVRSNINRYNLNFLNLVLAVTGSITMVCYIMYTVSDEVTARFQSNYVYTTSIFVLAGIIRYLQLTLVDTKSGSPTNILVKDRFIQLCILAWIISFAIIIYL